MSNKAHLHPLVDRVVGREDALHHASHNFNALHVAVTSRRSAAADAAAAAAAGAALRCLAPKNRGCGGGSRQLLLLQACTVG